jgi:plastocyanin
MVKKILWIILGIIVVVLLIWGIATNGWKANPKSTPQSVISPQKTTIGQSDVSIKNLSFNPSSLEIKINTVVNWINNDSTDHNIIADNGQFDSKTLSRGQKFSFQFNSVGEYSYHCSIHPTMKAKIIVK